MSKTFLAHGNNRSFWWGFKLVPDKHQLIMRYVNHAVCIAQDNSFYKEFLYSLMMRQEVLFALFFMSAIHWETHVAYRLIISLNTIVYNALSDSFYLNQNFIYRFFTKRRGTKFVQIFRNTSIRPNRIWAEKSGREKILLHLHKPEFY